MGAKSALHKEEGFETLVGLYQNKVNSQLAETEENEIWKGKKDV